MQTFQSGELRWEKIPNDNTNGPCHSFTDYIQERGAASEFVKQPTLISRLNTLVSCHKFLVKSFIPPDNIYHIEIDLMQVNL